MRPCKVQKRLALHSYLSLCISVLALIVMRSISISPCSAAEDNSATEKITSTASKTERKFEVREEQFSNNWKEPTFIYSDPVLQKLRLKPYFSLYNSTYGLMADYGLTPNSVFGVTAKVREQLTDAICIKIYRDNECAFKKGQTFEQIGASLRALVDATIEEQDVTSLSKGFYQYLCAEACCAWMIRNVFFKYDYKGSTVKKLKRCYWRRGLEESVLKRLTS